MNQGKYVLSQIMDFVPRYQFNGCVKKYNGNYRVKNFSCWEQFLSLSFGQLAHRESLRDIIVCLESQKEKLYHLGFASQKINRSTLSDANNQRNWRIYRDFAQILIEEARKIYFDDKGFNLDLDGTFYALDSSTIELCLSIFKWAKFRETKSAVKLHMLLDLRGNIPAFFCITEAKTHDVNFLDMIEIESGVYYIMDRGYLDYERLFKINLSGAFFVTRLKHNDFNIDAKSIANLYKNRWQIEIFFKWIKQNLKIRAFWGHSANAVKTQICIAICTCLMVAIIKKKLTIERNLYEILQILSVSAFNRIPLVKLISEADLQNFEEHPQKQPKLWDY